MNGAGPPPREGGQVFLVQLLLVAAILVIAAGAVAMSLRASEGAIAQEEQARAEGLAQQGVAQVLYELTEDPAYSGGPVDATRFWPVPPPAGTTLVASSSTCNGGCATVTVAACADDANWPSSPSTPVGFAIYEQVKLSRSNTPAVSVLAYRQYAVPISARVFGGFCSSGGAGTPP